MLAEKEIVRIDIQWLVDSKMTVNSTKEILVLELFISKMELQEFNAVNKQHSENAVGILDGV